MEVHTRSGNCWTVTVVRRCVECGEGNLCDACHEHDAPRGECEDCPECDACAEERL